MTFLSAKYGLVDLEQEIEPYDLTLKQMPIADVKVWADLVLNQLRRRSDLRNDHLVILAGEEIHEIFASSHLGLCCAYAWIAHRQTVTVLEGEV